jgi:plasmid stability protein
MSARTTIRLDDDLMRQLKERAARENTSLSKCTNQMIREGLRAASQPRKRKRFVQKTYNMGIPKIDITKATALAFEMEDEAMIQKMGLRQ